jgi:hypothetical protein
VETVSHDRRSRSTLRAPGAVLVGAALAFFFDPASGRRRRAQVAQRAPAFLRRRIRELARLGRRAASFAYGKKQKVIHLREEPKDLNDPALQAKVETILFRDADVPKGQVNVNVQHGVVQLRGEVPRPEMVEALVARARSIPGVRDVESLLHLPGTPAPPHR